MNPHNSPSPARKEEERFLIVQVWRALAAFIVVAGHANFESLALAQKTGWAFHFFPYPPSVGVEIFFVISGFVIVFASRKLIGAPGGWKPFIVRRLIRIVPLYWFYTTLILALVLLLPQYFETATPEFWHLLQSYFFIPHIRPGGDAVRPFLSLGWTLNYEMYFYLVFAALMFLKPGRLALALSVFFPVSVVIGLLVPESGVIFKFWFQPFVLEFLTGALIGFAYLKNIRLPRASFWPLTALGFALLFSLFLPHPESLLSNALQYLAAAILVMAGVLPRGAEHAEPPKILTTLGDSSYSLYLCHPLPLGVCKLLALKLGLGIPLYMLTGIISSLAAGHISYLLLEKTSLAFLKKRFLADKPRAKFPPVGGPLRRDQQP